MSVRLHVPTSDINFDLGKDDGTRKGFMCEKILNRLNVGNFMIRIWLQTSNGSSILHSSRPVRGIQSDKMYKCLQGKQ